MVVIILAVRLALLMVFSAVILASVASASAKTRWRLAFAKMRIASASSSAACWAISAWRPRRQAAISMTLRSLILFSWASLSAAMY